MATGKKNVEDEAVEGEEGEEGEVEEGTERETMKTKGWQMKLTVDHHLLTNTQLT